MGFPFKVWETTVQLKSEVGEEMADVALGVDGILDERDDDDVEQVLLRRRAPDGVLLEETSSKGLVKSGAPDKLNK